MASRSRDTSRRIHDRSRPHRRLYKRSPYGLAAWWSLVRGEHGLITFVAVVVAEMLVAGRYAPSMLFPALGPLLITWGAFALNDYFGYPSDKALARLDRPIVSGRVSRPKALAAALALLAVGLALCWPVGLAAFGLAAAYVLGSLLYDVALKKLPLVGNLFIASTMAVPFLYGNAALTNALEFHPLVWVLAGIAFFAGAGRELLKTLADVRGDKKLRARTFPMLAGPRATVGLAALFTVVAVFLSLAPFASSFSPIYALFVSIANVCFLASVEMSLKSHEERVLRRCRNYSLFGMAMGVLAFGALALGL